MCGIFSLIQRGSIDISKIQEYFDRIKHRGPDHTSHITLKHEERSVFLGFHRLAIIDPSPQSHDFLDDGNVYMTCNGEIYNYKYLIKKYDLQVKTGSDCEVILQLYRKHPELWPNEILQELDGVFAFVLFDETCGIGWAARDRVGVRPLFYGEQRESGAIAFASEGKAIPFTTARQFIPGNVMKFSMQPKNYTLVQSQHRWVPNGIPLNIDYRDSQTCIKNLLIAAVRKRLVADRPIGFLVSGGLDSSLIAAIAHECLGQRLVTFSIGLESSPDLIAARKVANHLNSDHHEVIVTTADILDAVPKVIYHNESYDITTTRASVPMYLISKYIREKTNIKVLFSGEGADELLGGYLFFHKAPTHKAFNDECHRQLSNLYKFDVLRADRTTSAWGLELRVPFLDADLLSVISNIDPAHRMPKTHKIEKAILRHAFDGYLPHDILYRQKQAFSDGVGYSSVDALKDFAKKNARTIGIHIHHDGYAIPKTYEADWYYMLFRNHYKEHIGLYTIQYWMPQWCDGVTDPSATVLDVHEKNLAQE